MVGMEHAVNWTGHWVTLLTHRPSGNFSSVASPSPWLGQTPLGVAPGVGTSSLALGGSLLSPGDSLMPQGFDSGRFLLPQLRWEVMRFLSLLSAA